MLCCVVLWCGVLCCVVVWGGVGWCVVVGVVWCGVVWCGFALCGVVRCGNMQPSGLCTISTLYESKFSSVLIYIRE